MKPSIFVQAKQKIHHCWRGVIPGTRLEESGSAIYNLIAILSG